MFQYQIFVTYRCNLHCKFCYQMFDLLPCGDASSDMTSEDIKVAGEILARRRVQVGKLRFSGGEPMLHPQIKQLFELAVETWHPKKYVRTYSSGKAKGAEYGGLNVAVAGSGKKARCHDPFLVSPVDVSLESTRGITNVCPLARGCGRGFDTYGFTPCPRAWSLGRLFGFDAHSAEPVALGNKQMCQHCLHSVDVSEFNKVIAAVDAGEIEYPSKTFKEAIEQRKQTGFSEPTKFIKRVCP